MDTAKGRSADVSKGLSAGAKAALGLVAIGATCVPCIGTSVAIGLPAFQRYTRRAQVTEARIYLAQLRSSIDAYGAPDHSLSATPDLSGLGGAPRPWPPSADPGWSALSFSASEPVRYAYSVTVDPAQGTVRIEAVGDLDGDGIRSSFSQLGRRSGEAILWEELVVLDELE